METKSEKHNDRVK